MTVAISGDSNAAPVLLRRQSKTGIAERHYETVAPAGVPRTAIPLSARQDPMNQARPTTAPPLRLVTRERRRTPRVRGPFNATWSGASGPGCRVPDLSVHGCYINTLSAPALGEQLTVTFVTDQGRTLHLKGDVRTVDLGIGFSVQFTEMATDDLMALAAWIGERATAEWEETVMPSLNDGVGY